MYDAFIDILETIPRGLVYVALGLAILTLAKLARDVVTPYRIDEQVTKSRNLAVSLRLSGYLVGTVLVFLGALYQPLLVGTDGGGLGFDRDFGKDVLEVFLYSLAGIVALNIVRIVVNRLVLYKFDIEKQIVEGKNVGAGAVEFGTYVATGLLIGGAASGEGGGADTALAFFGLGLVVLIIYALFYQFTTPFDIHREIEGDNTAVGIALGSNLVAMGLVTFKAVFGNFDGWNEALASFFVFVVIGFVLLFVLRLLIDFLLLPTAKISNELAVERNVGVAFVESSIVISSALILFFAI
jgi:uncharacterized membrane protein YjfL (UPF0719 family)